MFIINIEMVDLNLWVIIDTLLKENSDYNGEPFEKCIKEENSVDNLLEIYYLLEKSNSKNALLLKDIMENIIGEKYIEKYGIVPGEAMALGFLEMIVGKEILKTDYHGDDDYSHFDFISEEGHVIGIFINEVCINEVNFLDFFPYLKDLRISVAGLKQVKGLNKLNNLKYLNLRANCLTTLPDLKDLVNLEILFVGANPISYIEGITQFKKLRIIGLDDTKLPKKYIKKIYNSLYGS